MLGSGVAFLDGTVVNVALPRMAESLHAGFATMQWVLDAYLLTLGAFVLVGGAVGDLLGRRAVLLTGLIGFGVASLLCGVAPGPGLLIAARAVQGLAGALLVPSSLAIIMATFQPLDRDRAIGAWSGLSGLAGAVGPFIGGWLVDAASWRWVFLINVPLVALTVVLAVRYVPESRAEAPAGPRWRRLDVMGSVATAAALTFLVVPLIESTLATAVKTLLFAAAAGAAVMFVVIERRSAHPMAPLHLLRGRVFAVANAITFVVYGAMSGALFLVAVQLQTAMGYSALEAGVATVPITVLLLMFSARVGGLVPKLGARPLLTVGPIVIGVGLVLLTRAAPGASYAGGVLPGVLVFAVGLCLVVAPITSTALEALPASNAGLASGVNNAVARIAGLLAIAALPAVAGTTGTRLDHDGLRLALAITAVLAAAGGVLAWTLLPRTICRETAPDSVAE